MDNEKTQSPQSLKSRLSNFWYYNKLKVIAIAFVIFVVVISVFQMCSREPEDAGLVYAGPAPLTGAEFEGVRAVFSAVLPKDYNGDGKKYANIITYNVMSEAQINEMESEFGGANRTYYAKEYEAYKNMLLTGEYSIYLLDPWLYENLKKEQRLQKVTDYVADATINQSMGEYGVRLGDTALYRTYEALHVLPEDTVICLLKPYVFGASSKEDNYKVSIEIFKAILTAG